MFESATLKLTGWYLLILMTISLLFSVIIYQLTTNEVDARLDRLQSSAAFQSNVPTPLSPDLQIVLSQQAQIAATNLIVSLIYANVIILAAGGAGSYILARRTLRPIEEAHEAQSRFVSDASHELRTPLAIMKAELEVALRDSSLSKTEMRELLDSNLEEVDKLTRLSQTLLQLSRLDQEPPKHERVALTALTKQLANRFIKSTPHIELSMPKEEIYIEAHQPSIEELLTILIDNAIKYSPDDSPITIVVSSKGHQASIMVINGGDGIDASDLPYVFNRFYRTDASRTRDGDTGYGLGLSLAKKIVSTHRGDITVASTPGETTTFTVYLPLYKSAPLDQA